ncbi:helix-turn-helix domain-containing protein [Pseudomonas sp. CCI3.2]|uniref:helix-turn-helix domain-containing protein n=1 Tax=unclassified Pseudomonas TaxID=196821 RepID=UPI002AC9CB74|nr:MULTISPECIES: helix-turn-helix domain-containing protein [unclassified Pseudomonas]MEB0077654.1 helix-turn-helix domain-containing protein [Pseudomonas sp. MH10out]MEB0093910.1 helix-turn-helix domain-containing protein [Pseudomonas sp. CCI4.2]MEB0101352.1 helix-turn-helix domain-containing protein [Pseudomonas sp. CCI3.2]MEB0131459.1 helix-turn-helix domain-containing protein [Pseudomonas sp. CCI2.4]MEB0158469.1 helix-turn-helix domain-containing protein [Pseudomonas sp. AH2 (2023)]
MNEMGARLRQERKRLGYSQREMGLLGGVAANAQGKYESGERVPKADYLAALASEGLDVLYVLTNQRSTGTAVDTLLKQVAQVDEPDAVFKEVKHAVRHLLLRIEELSSSYVQNGKPVRTLHDRAVDRVSE